jgi:23S rRNA (adenine2030-N6)-methyltransferase
LNNNLTIFQTWSCILLSYRHSFHAGNFADVLKHLVQVEILLSLRKKDKPFEYIDTHSGAGLYNLESESAQKLSEFSNGIAKLDAASWPELEQYLNLVVSFNSNDKLSFYPGSPAVALNYLRAQDRAWLYELHPRDYGLLETNMASHARVRASQGDGFKGLLSHLPPTARRALILIDPSYEVKSDYDTVVDVLKQAHQKFATGIYALWYPVVERSRINRLEEKLVKSGIKNIQQFELGIQSDSIERGMTSAGMIVINPPWGLYEKLESLLPRLAKTLSCDGKLHHVCTTLVAE